MARKPSKKILLELAEQYAGVVTDVAKHCDVSRMTVYRWMEKDKAFKEKMDAGNEIIVDKAIKGLVYHLDNNSERTIHYTLDRLARHKGFGQLIKVQDKSKFEDQFADLSTEELQELLIKTNERIANG